MSDTEDADPFLATARCTIFSGDDIVDTYALKMGAPGSGFGSKVFTLQGITSTTGNSTLLSLRCRKGSNDNTQVSIGSNPRLTAIKIDEFGQFDVPIIE